MGIRTERGSIFEVAGIPKSRWKEAVRQFLCYAHQYVVGLDGLVYPSSMAVELGIDGYPVSRDRVALGMASLIRAGRCGTLSGVGWNICGGTAGIYGTSGHGDPGRYLPLAAIGESLLGGQGEGAVHRPARPRVAS